MHISMYACALYACIHGYMYAWMYGAAHPHMRMLHGVGDAVILRTCASPNGHIALSFSLYPYTIYVYETYVVYVRCTLYCRIFIPFIRKKERINKEKKINMLFPNLGPFLFYPFCYLVGILFSPFRHVQQYTTCWNALNKILLHNYLRSLFIYLYILYKACIHHNLCIYHIMPSESYCTDILFA